MAVYYCLQNVYESNYANFAKSQEIFMLYDCNNKTIKDMPKIEMLRKS